MFRISAVARALLGATARPRPDQWYLGHQQRLQRGGYLPGDTLRMVDLSNGKTWLYRRIGEVVYEITDPTNGIAYPKSIWIRRDEKGEPSVRQVRAADTADAWIGDKRLLMAAGSRRPIGRQRANRPGIGRRGRAMLRDHLQGTRSPMDSESPSFPPRRLVIFEGIMGSGKSTSSRWLAARLVGRGFDAQLHPERQYPHPLRGTDAASDWFKPWLDMTARDIAERRLALWREFVEKAMEAPTVYVIDGQLFHGDLTNMLLMKMPEPEIAANVRELEAIIQPLNPLLVYFHQTDVDRAIRLTAAERGYELGVRYQVNWKLAFPYAVELGLEGLTGLSALYVRYRALTDRLFADLQVDKIAIENTPRDWPRYYAMIEEALGF